MTGRADSIDRGAVGRSGRDDASPLLVVPFVLDGVEHVLVGLAAPEGEDRLAKLTGAERAVVCAALAGQSNPQISRARGVSVRTVANQLASAYRKLGVTSRTALASLLARVP